MSVWLFLRALLKHWWALLSSAFFTVLGLITTLRRESRHWYVVASFGLAVILLFVAAFLAWKEEHKKWLNEQEKNGRPDVDVSWRSKGGWLPDAITLRNIGGAIARHVQVGNFPEEYPRWERRVEVQMILPASEETVDVQLYEDDLARHRQSAVRLYDVLLLQDEGRPISLAVTFRDDEREYSRTFAFRPRSRSTVGNESDVIVERGPLSVKEIAPV